jgi:hypothetical protein
MVACLAVVMAAGGRAAAQGWDDDRASSWDDSPYRRGALVLPSFGFATAGESPSGEDPDVGPRMGALLGWHLGSNLSLNGEIGFDIVRPSAVSLRGDSHGLLFEYALSPLLHAGSVGGEFVLGPKVGRFSYSVESLGHGAMALDARGWSYGINAGVLLPVQTMAVGVLVSYTTMHVSKICEGTCKSPDVGSADFNLLGASLALLY